MIEDGIEEISGQTRYT